ncbi:hypothetical protein EJ02DRAFT_469100 [Clathrospora elynae]|uniref:Zn(2)-C6 fungal-type domain-containing protein n=1 Tax=Clathrospora elynae TaxID=706981 RepID=A0A6A5SFN9_9PLEO|nr:hypothetical protein EJ02DRAFT_469100 [Clathrospora elynae]
MTEPIRRRKRPAISCTLCRKRKMRCDRERPCSNCVRSKTGSCVYGTDVTEQRPSAGLSAPLQPRQNGPRVATAVPTPSAIPTPLAIQYDSSYASAFAPSTSNSSSSFELAAMKARIAELEDKLSQAASTISSVYSATASTSALTHNVETFTSFADTIDVLQDSRAFGRANAISRGIAHKNRVFGQSHWMNGFVIFCDIIEMMEPNLRSGSSPVLSSMHRAKVLGRIIKSQRSPAWPTVPTRDTPPRHVCDQLVAGYLRTMETVYRVLHVPTFQRTYENLWATDTEPSIDFMVLLKLVMAIGATVYDGKFTMRVEATRWVYEAQTWLSSPVFKSQLGVQYLQINTLLLLAREFVDVGSELVWISAGALYRAAVYIGLHKDPSQLPRMTNFEAEMRRRIWNTILEVSLQASMESGGPCFITLGDFNTVPPGNYDDEQLTAPDPIARPDHVYTQTSVAVAFRKTLPARLAVIKFLNDIASNGTYEETLRIDTELRAVHKTLRRTMQAYINSTASSPLQFALQVVEFLMQRYISSLHLPFFASSLQDPVYAFSRKATTDSSFKIWSLACPALTGDPIATGETDLARLSRCGSGFFRTFAFHASTFLAVELRARLQEDDDDMSTMSTPLSTIAEEAANWYLRCMEAGETGLKGYLLLRLLTAYVDATKRHLHRTEMPALLVQASEQAAEICLPMLEAMAGGQQQVPDAADMVDGSDFQLSPEFMEDWDPVMPDSFHFGDAGSFDAFFT